MSSGTRRAQSTAQWHRCCGSAAGDEKSGTRRALASCWESATACPLVRSSRKTPKKAEERESVKRQKQNEEGGRSETDGVEKRGRRQQRLLRCPQPNRQGRDWLLNRKKREERERRERRKGTNNGRSLGQPLQAAPLRLHPSSPLGRLATTVSRLPPAPFLSSSPSFSRFLTRAPPLSLLLPSQARPGCGRPAAARQLLPRRRLALPQGRARPHAAPLRGGGHAAPPSRPVASALLCHPPVTHLRASGSRCVLRVALDCLWPITTSNVPTKFFPI